MKIFIDDILLLFTSSAHDVVYYHVFTLNLKLYTYFKQYVANVQIDED